MESKLFSPVTFGPLTLRNRTIRSAAFESMCPENTPTQMLLDYHRSVAAGGVGMTTVAYAAVTQSGLSFDRQLWLRPSIIPRLHELTKAVHDEGAAVGIQIGHCGNMSHKKICGVTPISASSGFNLYSPTFVRGMEKEELPEMDELTTLCFGFIRASLDANAKKYYAECEQNRENGRKGGRPKKADGFEENRTVFSESGGFSSKPAGNRENPIESVSDSDIDSESDSVSVSESETREEEREKFFEIFFFRNFRNPANEVDRFVNHYQATGWMRKGEKVVDKAALARAWTEEKTSEPLRYPVRFLQCWHEIYDRLSTVAVCRDMLTDLQGVEITRDRLTLTVSSRRLAALIEGNIRLAKPILDYHYPGRTLHYRVPKGV